MCEEDNDKIAQLEARIAQLEEAHRILAEGIPPFAHAATINNPFGSGPNVYTLANPSSGGTDTIPTATSNTTLSNKNHDSTINFTVSSTGSRTPTLASNLPTAAAGTTNATWVQVQVGGTTRFIPAW